MCHHVSTCVIPAMTFTITVLAGLSIRLADQPNSCVVSNQHSELPLSLKLAIYLPHSLSSHTPTSPRASPPTASTAVLSTYWEFALTLELQVYSYTGVLIYILLTLLISVQQQIHVCLNSSDNSCHLLRQWTTAGQEAQPILLYNRAAADLPGQKCCRSKPQSLFVAGSPGASVALRLLKERADSAEARANSATRQIAELKASLQVNQALSFPWPVTDPYHLLVSLLPLAVQ